MLWYISHIFNLKSYDPRISMLSQNKIYKQIGTEKIFFNQKNEGLVFPPISKNRTNNISHHFRLLTSVSKMVLFNYLIFVSIDLNSSSMG